MAIYDEIIKPLYSLTNRRKIDEEMFEDSEIWSDALFGIVPVNRLRQSWRRACRDQAGNFAPNFFDVKNKWLEIEAAEARAAEAAALDNPVERCTHKNLHKTAAGETIALNHYSGKDELIPCPHCRPKDLEAWKKTQIALYGEHKPAPVTPAAAVEIVTRPSEPFLSRREAEEMRTEYNDLVEQLVDEEKARRDLFVIFDEGANVFRPPHRRDLLISPKDMRAKIERYKKVLEERGNG